MLSTDHDFTTFLLTRDPRRVALEKFITDRDTLAVEKYMRDTARWRKAGRTGVVEGMHTRVTPKFAPVPEVTAKRDRYTFTPEQFAIAIAAQETKLQKRAS